VSRLRYEVELTTTGYLYLSADLASTRFPHDAVLATLDDHDLLLWPTSGSSAGGLLLKQRNASGDRGVLISEFIPVGTPCGRKDAFWDERRYTLRVLLTSELDSQAIGASATVVPENGRWAVYLEVGFWEKSDAGPLKMTRQRIKDYPTRRAAEVAASWIQRSADRNVQRPLEGG